MQILSNETCQRMDYQIYCHNSRNSHGKLFPPSTSLPLFFTWDACFGTYCIFSVYSSFFIMKITTWRISSFAKVNCLLHPHTYVILFIQVNVLLVYLELARSKYRSNNVLITMGEDFHYQAANMWFNSLDKLIL